MAIREEETARIRVSFSRNFGKEAGIYAGFQKSKGDYVVMMDADLQDPPSLLPEMFSYIEQGYDSVATRRVSRKGEPPIRSFFARMFYKIMKPLIRTPLNMERSRLGITPVGFVSDFLSLCYFILLNKLSYSLLTTFL